MDRFYRVGGEGIVSLGSCLQWPLFRVDHRHLADRIHPYVFCMCEHFIMLDVAVVVVGALLSFSVLIL